MSRRQRRGKQHATENNERWLITYSDLITLLMIFFVIMYAMSKIDQAKFMTLSQSLQAALHKNNEIPLNNLGKTGIVVPANPQDLSDSSKTSTSTANMSKDKQLDNLYKQVQAFIQQHHLDGNVSVESEPRGVQITLRDVVLFESGQAVIKPDAQKLLSGLVPFLQNVNNPIVIEGHTDNQPIATSVYPSNWELSSARAVGVVRFFQSQHIVPQRLSGVGYGEFHPVAPNDTEAHRQLNRRINIVILRQSPVQVQDNSH